MFRNLIAPLLLLVSINCYGQYEYLLHKPFAERYMSLDTLFISEEFLKMDSAAAFNRINTIRDMAVKYEDEELVMETVLGECSYYQYGNLSSRDWYLSDMYAYAYNSKWYIETLTNLAAEARIKGSRTVELRALILLGLEYYARREFDKSLEHFLEFYYLILDVTYEEYPRKKEFLIYMGKFFYRLQDYKVAEYYLTPALAVPTSYMVHEEMDLFNTIGLIKREKGEYDSALYYFIKAREAAIGLGSTTWPNIINGNIGIVYYMTGLYNDAKPLLKRDVHTSLKRKDYSNAINSVIKLAELYKAQHNYDSSQYYASLARWVVDSVQPPYKYLVPLYRLKSKLAEQNGNVNLAYKYSDSALQANAQLNEISNSTDWQHAKERMIDSIYAQELEKLAVEKKQETDRRNMIIGLVVIISATGFIVLGVRNQRKKAKKVLAESQLTSAKKELEDFTEMIQEKNRLLEASQSEISKLKEGRPLDGGLPNDIIEKLQLSTILTDEEWDNFKNLFEQVHSGFLQRLKQKYPNMSPAETRLVALYKLNFGTKEMTGILGVGASTIRTHKYRLRKKLNIPDEEAFSAFVRNI